jgi:23S rRNA (guanine745-N1)-methyltransferase
MVAARSAFLGAGHLAPIDDALVAAAADIAAQGAIVDLGGGTGQHLTPVLDALPDRTGIVLDSSAPALRRAARAHPHAAAIAADAWGPLPLRDGSAAAVLSVFAPRGAEELRRILAPGGLVLAVTPTDRHLAELREPLGLLSTDAGKADRLAAQLGLRERARTLVETTLTLTAEEATQAARMGPAAHHDRKQRPLPATVTATLSVELTVLCSPV